MLHRLHGEGGLSVNVLSASWQDGKPSHRHPQVPIYHACKLYYTCTAFPLSVSAARAQVTLARFAHSSTLQGAMLEFCPLINIRDGRKTDRIVVCSVHGTHLSDPDRPQTN